MDALDELLGTAGVSPPSPKKHETTFADRQEESAWAAQTAHDPFSAASDSQERSAIAAEKSHKAYVPAYDRQEKSAMAAEASHRSYTDSQERSAERAHEANKAPRFYGWAMTSEPPRVVTDINRGAGNFLSSVISGGDRAWGGLYGTLAAVDEAATSAAKSVKKLFAGDQYESEPYVSPFRDVAQYHNEKADETLREASKGYGDFGKRVMSAGQATGNMLAMSSLGALAGGTGAGMGARFGTGGAALGASTAQKGLNAASNMAARLSNELLSHGTNAAVSLGSAGQTYLNAVNRGAEEGRALQNAVLAGLLEYESNKMFSGTPLEDTGEKGYVNKLFEYAADRLGKSEPLKRFLDSNAGKAAGFVFDKSGEGAEEVVSAIGEPLLERITWNPRKDLATADELVDAAIDGVLLSAMMSGGEALIDNAYQLAEAQKNTTRGAAESQNNGTPIRVGRATTIYHPYQGTIPVQTQYVETPINLTKLAVSQADERIQRAINESAEGKESFKGALSRIYKLFFRGTSNVPVQNLAFEGHPYLVQIGNRVPQKVISDPNLSAEKLALLEILPDVVQNGKYLGSGEYVQHSSRAKPGIRYDYFETPVKLETVDESGKQFEKWYIAKFDVEVLPGVNNYRTHQIIDVDLITSEARLAGKVPVPSSGETSPHLQPTIPQPSNPVKFGEPATTMSYADAFRQMQPQKPPPATPYADLFRKFLEEYGGTREP